MAAETQALPINGNYGQHHGYGIEQQHNPYAAQQQSYSQAPPAAPTSTATTSTNGQSSDIPKDEVGWYFVEQYYTTLSKQPEQLYLYYHKRSQFVSGNETDKVQVCVGQRAINERIKELDFQDCKVRITNVDSQASDQHIVIQVIGEISNKSQPHRKFTQTFVLATQTNGYFVLNDIFRYIIEEEDEVEPQTETGAQAEEEVEEKEEEKEEETPAATTTTDSAPVTREPEPKSSTISANPSDVENDVKAADEKVEKQTPTPSAEVNGVHKEDAAADEEKATSEPAAEVSEEPERTTEPEPTRAASPAKQAPSQPAAAPKSTVPKTWASMLASGNKVATPAKASAPAAAAAATTATAPAASPSQPKSADAKAQTSAPASAPSTTNAASPAAQEPAASESQSQDEWTAVGSNHNRQQSRQVNGQQSEGPQRKAYIKNVNEGVQTAELREALEKFGKVSHIDISRPKNCAFVDFETPEGYQAAVSANPHTIGSESLYVEERKVRQGNTPFVPRGQFQGGRGGRGDFRGGRGGFNPRGRGQGAARGARGGAQQS